MQHGNRSGSPGLGSLLADLNAWGLATDGELVERFRVERSEAAFAALVDRHGPMVHRVCRAVLGDRDCTQDAFQATFLILARRVGSIRRGDAVGPWLYGVARRVAVRARVDEARRRRHERGAALADPVSVAQEPSTREAHRLIDEEVARLPGRDRAVVVFCYFEGLSYEGAAERLGVTEATVRGRLARARDRLRDRLKRRGVDRPDDLLGLGFGAAEAVTRSLGMATLRLAGTAGPGPAGLASPSLVPGSVLDLAEKTMRMLLVQKLRWIVATTLILAAPVAGAAALAQLGSQQPAAKSKAGVVATPPATKAAPSAGSTNPTILRYGDGTPDGKKSLGGSGEMIRFTVPTGTTARNLIALRIHGARYGQAAPPPESFLIHIDSDEAPGAISTRLAPLKLFEQGDEQWVDIPLVHPVTVSSAFWVTIDFRATGNKGVYVSFDSSTKGQHSQSGLPGLKAKPFPAGDWMVEAVLAD